MKKLVALMLAAFMLVSVVWTAGNAENGNNKPAEYKNADGYAFVVKEDGTAEITKYTGKENKLVIPAQLDGYTVTSLGKNAFTATKCTSVTVPDSVTEICPQCFENAKQLEKATLPEGLKIIGKSAFSECWKLKTINIPLSAEVDGCIFGGCKELREISISKDHPSLLIKNGVLFSRDGSTLLWYPAPKADKKYQIPEGTQTIVTNAFARSQAEEIILPDSISTLERQAFRGCEKLKKINIPPLVENIIGFAYTCNHLAQVAVDAKNPYYRSVDGVVFDRRNDQLVFYPAGRTDQKYVIPPGTKSVGANAFANAQIEEVEIPDTITEIGPNAFFYNPNLRTVILPEGLEIINSGAFSCCKSLETISLPSSLVWMGYNPFEQCDSLEAIQMDQDHPTLMMVDNVLVRKEDMCLIWYPAADRRNRYEIPAGIKTIGVEAFSYCDINEIVIPEGVEKISAHAFTSVQNLERVVLPASLSDIEPLAFNSSDDITFVVIPGSFSEEYCAANDRRIEYP